MLETDFHTYATACWGGGGGAGGGGGRGARCEREARAPRAAVRGVEGGKGERRVGRVGIVIDNCRKFLVLLIVEEKKNKYCNIDNNI
jgi:hypothetical protein